MVADLRSAVVRYPADHGLRDLVHDLRAASEEFAALWSAAESGRYHHDQMTVAHPDLGPLKMDKDVLTIEPGDLRVVVFTIPVLADLQEATSTGSM